MNPASAPPRNALPRRGSSQALGFFGVLLLTCLAALAHTAWAQRQATLRPNLSVAMVQALHLTDLALFTEARYTRHLMLPETGQPGRLPVMQVSLDLWQRPKRIEKLPN